MQDLFSFYSDFFLSANKMMKHYYEKTPVVMKAVCDQTIAAQAFWASVLKYMGDFMSPSINAFNSFQQVEGEKTRHHSPAENIRDYGELVEFNAELARKGFFSGMTEMNKFFLKKMNENSSAWLNLLIGHDGDELAEIARRQKELTEILINEYPKAIRGIKSEFGFHFDNGGYVKVAETDRFELYQVLPQQDTQVKVREDGKPIIIIPPYVLGPNILAFLPGEKKSYVHCFANQGIPTFIRIVKDIDTTPAVQLMTAEDDALDTRYLTKKVKEIYGKPVTLNGFCQGGYHAVINLLSGVLDGLVDALITCAAPMDGSKSKSLVEYMKSLPPRFLDMSYASKILPNGNKVVDGEVMAWVYRLRKIEAESPMVTFYRDLELLDDQKGHAMKISKTAAAINYWTIYERTDLPYGITKISFESYTKPVAADGTLPVKLFDRELNFRRIKEMGIPWLICIAEKDDLVDREASLAPLPFIDAEVTVFPKGHASIATSWSLPTSDCALQLCLCVPGSTSPDGRHHRGPVHFQLDLEKELKDMVKGDTGGDAVTDTPEGDEQGEKVQLPAPAGGRKKTAKQKTGKKK